MDQLGIVLFVIAIFGWGFIALKLFGHNFLTSFFIGIQLLITLLYAFALADALVLGFYLILTAGVLAFLIGTYQTRTKTNLQNLGISILFAVPYLIFTISIPRSFRFTMSDEFPSWAANIRTMYVENQLGGINSATRGIADGFYQSYPPFQQLFQYFFLRLNGWSEANVQIAQNVLVITLILGATSLILKDKKFPVFIAWVSSIALYHLFGFSFSNLLADGLLAIQFAVCLSLGISNTRKLKDTFLLALLVGNLLLIKPTGFVFAICTIAFATIMLFMPYLSSPRTRFKPLMQNAGKNLMVLFLIPAAYYLSWQVHLREIRITPGASQPTIRNLFSEETHVRWLKTWDSYKQNFFGSLAGEDNLAGISSTAPLIVQRLSISLFVIFVVLSIAHLILAFLEKKQERNKAISAALTLITMAIFYQLFLLALYMFFFGQYEGVRSAALVRYSGSFFLAWSIYVLCLLISQLTSRKRSRLFVPLMPVLLLIAAPSSMAAQASGAYVDTAKLPIRLTVEKLVPRVLKNVPEGSRVYYVHQKSDGYEKYIFSYLVLPIQTNWTCPSLGDPYYEGDVWTCDFPLKKVLDGYDYLAVGQGDMKFWKANSILLARGSRPQVQGLYKVEGDQHGITLREIK
jgi:hypothetical protein